MKIIEVPKNTLGHAIGLRPGDRLRKINGKRVQDEIDYRFRICDEHILLDIEVNGKLDKVEVEKEYDDDLGVIFEEFKIRKCANDCVFCFVDQNPDGMRSGMYFRDGDFRLSYLHGHYITMTNMNSVELDRVVEQRLSPLYISVHATDVELRKRLLLYKHDDNLLEKIEFLTNNGIELHSQIVLIPGLNDGKYLIQTIKDLYKYYPHMNSLSIVPVGLTKHRSNLPLLNRVTPNYANKMVEYIDDLNIKYKSDNKHPFVLLSDEWYILSNAEIPNKKYYGDLDLIENGVGQVRSFIDNFNSEIDKFPKKFNKRRKFTIITGRMAENIFKEQILPIINKIINLDVNLKIIQNNFYGDSVQVAGLLTGKDIIEQCKDDDLGEAVWCSHRILNDEGILTLDDYSLEDLSLELGVSVNVSHDSILDIFDRNIVG